MDPQGDITDAFDDDLRGAIERGREGPWHEDKPVFTDPKLGSLERRLSGAQERSYQERRLQEMQARAMADPATPKRRARNPAAKPTAPKPVWGEDPVWREGPEAASTAPDAIDWGPDARRLAPESAAASEETATPATAADAPRTTDPMLLYAPSMFAATLVFVAATTVHGLLGGFALHLLTRTIAAIAITGFLWQRFQAGRLRAITIGCGCYAAAYVPLADLTEPRTVFALVLGLLLTMAGAGLIGVQRSEFDAGRS